MRLNFIETFLLSGAHKLFRRFFDN